MGSRDLLGCVGNDSEVMFGMSGKEVWNKCLLRALQDKHRHSFGFLSPCIIIQAGSPVIGRVSRTNVLIVSLMSE